MWFEGKEITDILGYIDTDQALRKNISEKYKQTYLVYQTGQLRSKMYVSEPGFYEFVFSTKLKTAEKLRVWVFSKVLPSIWKYGQLKLFNNKNNRMFKLENETDLHYKVVDYISRFYP